MSLRMMLAFALGSSALAGDGFEKLFKGKKLKGWHGDPRLWSVRDGMIAGSTEGVSLESNSFLVTRKPYADFILKAQVRLRNHKSGILFRGEARPVWSAAGYRAGIGENDWSSLCEEGGGRGVLAEGWTQKAENVAKLQDWNDYEIRCEGPRIQLLLNGLQTAEINDATRLDGVIAFELQTGPPMEAYFRNINIKILKPEN
jgi:3-keto-disaccharide hydrolase